MTKSQTQTKNFFDLIGFKNYSKKLLNLQISDNFVTKTLVGESKNLLQINFISDNFFHPADLLPLYQYCQKINYTHADLVNDLAHIEFTIKYTFAANKSKMQSFLCKYTLDICKLLYEVKLSQNEVRFFESDKILEIFSSDVKKIKIISTHQLEIIKILNSFGFNDFSLRFSTANNNIYNNLSFLKKPVEKDVKPKKYFNNSKITNFNANDYPLADFAAVLNQTGTFLLQGQIISMQKRFASKSNNPYWEIYATDWDITLKFWGYDNDFFDYNDFKVNDFVNIYCQVKSSRSRRSSASLAFADDSQVFSIIKLSQCEPLFGRNISSNDKKRIELCAHSKMTPQDSICNATDYIDFAVKNKMPAVSILDYNSIQAFPAIANHPDVKAKKIKPIYGFQVDLIDDRDVSMVTQTYHGDALLFANQKYCAFDLETTGLHANYRDVIEFGAVLFETDDFGHVNNNAIQRIQFFIKCDYPLPANIIAHTNITDEMLAKSGLDHHVAAKKIKSIISERILIAHNASFDLNFLNSFFTKYGESLVKNTVLDTLWMARYFYKEFKRHTLEFVCQKLGVEYDTVAAHRADYDANVLFQVFANFFLPAIAKELSDQEKTVDALQNIFAPSLHTRNFGNRISILAKNKAGLKTLYKLLSIAHTDDIVPISPQSYFGIPKLNVKSLLQHKNNDILIASSALKGKIMKAALNLPFTMALEQLELYDYLEVPTPKALSHLAAQNSFSKSDIQQLILQLVKLAQNANKLACAVSDSYYLHPWHKKYRLPFIFTKGLRGRYHEYFSFALKNEIECERVTLSDKHQQLKETINREIANIPHVYFCCANDLIKQFDFLSEQQKNLLIYEHPDQINQQIEYFDPLVRGLHAPTKFADAYEKILSIVNDKFKQIYHDSPHKMFHERLEQELSAIKKYKYEVIYYLSYLLTNNSKKSNYLVGSRGSVGSSFVAFLLGITEVNPLAPHYYCDSCDFCEFPSTDKYKCGFDLPIKKCPHCQRTLLSNGHNIPFATFLGFNNEKTPDIDLNFSGEYQQQAHNYMQSVVGKENIFRAGTITTYADKMAENLVCDLWDFLFLIFPQSTRTRADLMLWKTFITDCKRSSGQHPGGLIVIPDSYDIYDFTPCNYPADKINSEWKTTHLPFESLHDSLLKLDLLGHDDPTVLKHLHDLTKKNPETISFADPKVLALFNSINSIKYAHKLPLKLDVAAIALPEFGTQLARQMLVETKPQSFADLVKISGLSHGRNVWKSNLRDLVYVNKEKQLQDVMGCRDDIMIDLINFGVPQAVAFKVMESVRKGYGVSSEHLKVLQDSKVPEWYISACQKINYLFPKAHATAYVIMAWRIAYYKLYYPLQFYCAHLSIRFNIYDYECLIANDINFLYQQFNHYNKLAYKNVKNRELALLSEVLLEIYARGIKIKSIDLQKSLINEFVIDLADNALIPPLCAIDSLGNIAAKNIVDERNANGKFASFLDLTNRVKLNAKQRKEIEKFKII